MNQEGKGHRLKNAFINTSPALKGIKNSEMDLKII